MKRILSVSGFLFVQLFSFAQYRITFLIDSLPVYHQPDQKVYLVGSFNNWDPMDKKLVLGTLGNHYGITIELPRGMFEYKFTKGGWDKVESLDGGI